MKAVEQLGEGRCYPMEILEVMNFPGLTRMQVAIHLQKCRRNNWRSPKERKYIRHLSRHQSSTVSHEPRSIHRRFGTIPCLQVNIPNQQSNPDQIQRDQEFSVLEFSVPTLCTNNFFSGGESTIQQKLYHPQLQVQPHYLDIGNSFHNPLLATQTNVGGGLQQQDVPLIEILSSQGLQDPIIGYSTINDYNINVNVDNVTNIFK